MGKALMVQGTASSVGKSVLVTGLCRLFQREGVRVAPFKAQNMALNSFATPDGREIGRAQAAQAVAARIPPQADMNPILLKPEGDARAQVMVEGRVWGTLSAADYQRRKEEFWPIVAASLGRLLDEFDLVVIEGAGSPVEMNLKEHDIVNMRVARAAAARVLLVADIDRGGVFASLVGTMELLDPAERELVGGFIVNKFRGDQSLFEPGVRFLEARLARPVLGVVPWIEGISLPEEDSQGLDEALRRGSPAPTSVLDIAVVRLPRMANFDDFDPLIGRPGVGVRYVHRPDELGEPDLVIVPGTKTTRADLEFVRTSGLGRAVVSYARRGGAVLGICGGYQMLGETIEDPEGVEGPPGSEQGLGLLPARTGFSPEKATVQVSGQVVAVSGLLGSACGTPVVAYEIHMGRTEGEGNPAFSLSAAGGAHEDGLVSADGWVVGTYLHGILANTQLREAMLDALARRRDVSLPAPGEQLDPYDHLADVLSNNLAIRELHALAGV